MIRAATTSVDETRSLAAGLAPLVQPGDLVLLDGDLGSGKTAFTQGLARGLGVTEPVTSPAFTLARTYEAGRLPLVHLDVYRLDRLQELLDIGITEMLDDDGVTVVEWGDAVVPALPHDFLEVALALGAGDDDRLLTITAVGPSWPPRMRAVRAALAPWSTEPRGEGTEPTC
ncbi:MAG: tRNA (adenosine(37)-N6)-threonylcarbamoyltransferase complex ATPase subunit type 1 TsaE [Acidimicrobiales bacterium]